MAQTLYDSERRQLLAGTSTTYLVLERQKTLVAAQATEVQSETDLNKAILTLQRIISTPLPERRNFTADIGAEVKGYLPSMDEAQ